MLVLSRKQRQAITITVNGVRIRVSINRIDGNRVSIAVEAPREVHIVRSELEGRAA